MNFYIMLKWTLRDLKVFGCRIIFYIPKQFRTKLSNSSLPGQYKYVPQNFYSNNINLYINSINTYLASVKANDTKKLIPLLELLMIMPKKLIK